MEKRMKNRLALLSILLVAGLLMAGMATAFGAEKTLQGKPSVFRALVDQNGSVVIDQDGKVVQVFTLPEGEEYNWETSSGGIRIGKMTSEEIQRKQAEHETTLNKWFEIAKKDSRVQEITTGKDYKIFGAGQAGTYEKPVAVLGLEVEGKYYKVAVDLKSEAVISVEEQNSSKIEISYGEKVSN